MVSSDPFSLVTGKSLLFSDGQSTASNPVMGWSQKEGWDRPDGGSTGCLFFIAPSLAASARGQQEAASCLSSEQGARLLVIYIYFLQWNLALVI